MLTGPCQRLEELGDLTAAYTLLNSLRTLFAEAAVLMEESEPRGHPCRDCDRYFDEHPAEGCLGWR